MPQLPQRLAVLDDEPEMRKALRRLLLTRGFQVEVYADGEALLAGCCSTPPDCLVLDLHMPGMNGFDVLEAFAAWRPALPIVVLTGQGEPDTAERVRALGAAAYLNKPVDETTLFAAIDAALAGSSQHPDHKHD